MRTIRKRKVKKKRLYFKPQVRSRHPSHKVLKQNGTLPKMRKKSVVRFGSTKNYEDTVAKGGRRVEVNTVEAIKNSANKLRMKLKFSQHEVPTADWFVYRDGLFVKNGNEEDTLTLEELPFPIITKHINGSRNKGNQKHDSTEDLEHWLNKKLRNNATSNYILEKYHAYVREYRLHVTADGCFYTCRKMLKRDTPDHKKWFRNDQNSVWILESNEQFDKPVNWDNIEEASVNALRAVGLDFGAVDLKVQSATKRNGEPRSEPKFFVIEINSAPSFGDLTKEKYIEEIPKLINKKIHETYN